MQLPNVAYISLWLPKPSETFIFREVVRLQKMGLPVTVHTLYGPLKSHLSPEMRQFQAQVHTMGTRAIPRMLRDVAWWWRRNPGLTRQLLFRMPITKWGNLEKTGENLWAHIAGFHLARRFQEQRIQHIHSPWAGGACNAALVASTLTGIPFSFAARAGDIYPPEKALNDKADKASFIRVNTETNVSYLRGFTGQHPDKVKLVYNALTLEDRGQAEVAMRPPYRLAAMGRFVRTKGFDVLLDACRLLVDQGEDVRLTLIGDGNWRSRLERQTRELGLEDRVEYPGFVSHERICEVLGQADVFVTPSVVAPAGDRDGIPNVIMEAMVNGLPVVATDVAGIKEVVRDRDTGMLVQQRDPRALADAIRELLHDRDLALRLAAGGRDLVLELFDHEKNCARLMELFSTHAAPAAS